MGRSGEDLGLSWGRGCQTCMGLDAAPLELALPGHHLGTCSAEAGSEFCSSLSNRNAGSDDCLSDWLLTRLRVHLPWRKPRGHARLERGLGSVVQGALDAEGAKQVDARVLLSHLLGALSQPPPQSHAPRRAARLPLDPSDISIISVKGLPADAACLPAQTCSAARLLGPVGAGLLGAAQIKTGPAPPIPCPGADISPDLPALQGCWAGVLSDCWSCSCMCLGALSLLPRSISCCPGWLCAPGHNGTSRKATAD